MQRSLNFHGVLSGDKSYRKNLNSASNKNKSVAISKNISPQPTTNPATHPPIQPHTIPPQVSMVFAVRELDGFDVRFQSDAFTENALFSPTILKVVL